MFAQCVIRMFICGYVCMYARTIWSPAAFAALYGVLAFSGLPSVKYRLSAGSSPYTSMVDTCR